MVNIVSVIYHEDDTLSFSSVSGTPRLDNSYFFDKNLNVLVWCPYTGVHKGKWKLEEFNLMYKHEGMDEWAEFNREIYHTVTNWIAETELLIEELDDV